jgi:hypothetical protein
MTAAYPTIIKEFSRRQDGRDVVVANDVNVVYDEVQEIETQLGVGGVTISNWASGSSFSTATSNWYPNGGLKARLDNIEVGVLRGINGSVATAGGSTITPSGTSIVGVTIKGASGQTANLLEVKNSSNAVLASVNKDGVLQVVTIRGGTA